MTNSVTLAGYTITFVDAVCNSDNTQTWKYSISITTTSPPGQEISDWVLQLCSNPVQKVVNFSAPAGITAETETFRSCLSNSSPPPPITTFNGIKYDGVNNNNVTGTYTFTINGCFQKTDVNIAVKTGGGDPSSATCFLGVITGPSCTPIIQPTTPAPTSAPCQCCSGTPTPVNFEHCELEKTVDVSATVNCVGRVLDVDVTLKNVCPNKLVNIGVLVFDENNKLITFKVCKFSTDSTPGTCIPSVNAGKFCFVFDDDSCPSTRTLTVRVVSNYVEI